MTIVHTIIKSKTFNPSRKKAFLLQTHPIAMMRRRHSMRKRALKKMPKSAEVLRMYGSVMERSESKTRRIEYRPITRRVNYSK